VLFLYLIYGREPERIISTQLGMVAIHAFRGHKIIIPILVT